MNQLNYYVVTAQNSAGSSALSMQVKSGVSEREGEEERGRGREREREKREDSEIYYIL